MDYFQDIRRCPIVILCLMLVVHRVQVFLLEKATVVWLLNGKLDDQKDTIMPQYSHKAPPSKGWHFRVQSDFPLLGQLLNQPLSQRHWYAAESNISGKFSQLEQ